MSNLKLVVDNRESVKHLVLKNLMDCDGKPVALFHAIRNIEDLSEATKALKELVNDGLIERQEIGAWKHIYYRYKSELRLYRHLETSKTS